MEIQEKIEALRKEIEYHIERYYNQDDPEITDYEYDQKRASGTGGRVFSDTKSRRKCKT